MILKTHLVIGGHLKKTEFVQPAGDIPSSARTSLKSSIHVSDYFPSLINFLLIGSIPEVQCDTMVTLLVVFPKQTGTSWAI